MHGDGNRCKSIEAATIENNEEFIYLSVANRYRFMREEGTDECTQGE